MLTLTLRTDKPESEIGLYQEGQELNYLKWEAHRQLAETINSKLQELLQLNKLQFKDVDSIIFYSGPGSFTGLRIGASVANALAYSMKLPLVNSNGDNWIKEGLTKLSTSQIDRLALPKYGQPINITKQKK